MKESEAVYKAYHIWKTTGADPLTLYDAFVAGVAWAVEQPKAPAPENGLINKDPQITPEIVKEWLDKAHQTVSDLCRNNISWIMSIPKALRLAGDYINQLSTELSQLRAENLGLHKERIEITAILGTALEYPWVTDDNGDKYISVGEHTQLTLADEINAKYTKLLVDNTQLRAERAGLDEEALDNASTLAFHLFDQQGWDLGELSAEEITKRIIQRYLEISKLTRTEQTTEEDKI